MSNSKNNNKEKNETKTIISLEELNAISDAYSEITEPKEFMKLFDHSDDFIEWLKIGTPEDVQSCLDRFKKARLRNAPKVIEQFLQDYVYDLDSKSWREFEFPTDLPEEPNPNQVTLEDAIKEAEEERETKEVLDAVQGVGAGDIVEKVTKATGIKKVVDKVSEAIGVDCGCEERKEEMNKFRIFQKLRPKCLTEEEVETLKNYFENKTSVISKEEQQTLLPIYNRVLRRKQEMTSCVPCWENIINTLESILKYY